MRADLAMIGLHSAAVLLAFVTSLAWPRTGESAVVVPMASTDLPALLRWADGEGAQIIEIDTNSGRVVARFPESLSLFRTLGAGIVLVTAGARGCQQTGEEQKS